MLALWICLGVLVVLIIAFAIFADMFFQVGVPRVGRELKPQEGAEPPWHPFEDVVAEAEKWNMDQKMEDVYITSFDGLKLHARFFPAEGTAERVVLCAHGYRGAPFKDFCLSSRWLHEHGCAVLLIDERAHGQSEGKYICYGVKERFDVRDWAKMLDERFEGKKPIYLYGVSMGCATVMMATALDLPKSVAGIIADCGYTTPAAICGRTLHGIINKPVYPMMWFLDLECRIRAHYSVWGASAPEALAHNTRPVFFVHGTADDFVPPEMTKENYAACASEKELFMVEGAKHANSFLVDPEGYASRLAAFFARCEKRPAAEEAKV
jgi:pimeloyl-ACP methyl ester carboxylesterase